MILLISEMTSQNHLNQLKGRPENLIVNDVTRDIAWQELWESKQTVAICCVATGVSESPEFDLFNDFRELEAQSN